MERPQIRQIENQRVESEREITGYEAEELLRKYGYGSHQFSTTTDLNQNHNEQPQTFEEMIRLEEEKRKNEYLRKQQQLFGPKPITFDNKNGYDSEVKYGQDDDSGFNFKIEIVSDMKIPK